MSFSNTNITDKPADPYKAANKDETSLETKVEGLVNLITTCKFGMMTTHEANTDNLVSRCMALAATVRFPRHQQAVRSRTNKSGNRWHRPHFPHKHRVRQD